MKTNYDLFKRWNAGGSFHGRLFTVPDEVLPTRYVNKVENDTIAVELETGLETEDVLEQMVRSFYHSNSSLRSSYYLIEKKASQIFFLALIS